MWPTENTAFLVIHGNGQQRQYETLDRFTRNFWEKAIVPDPEVEVKEVNWEHMIDDRARSYVRFKRPGHPYIDFYEYYWDCYMVRDITIKQLKDWLNDFNRGINALMTGDLKKDFPENYKLPILLKVVKSGLPQILFSNVLNRIIKFLAKTLLFMLPIPCVTKLFLGHKADKDGPGVDEDRLRTEKGWLEMLSEGILDSVLNLTQDIAIYCLHNQRSSYYNMRKAMLDGAVNELKGLLKSREEYQRIIVVGHSLGSVIAYDALNRIALDMSLPSPLPSIPPELAKNIKGLVTFGSFLDVAAGFFQDHVDNNNVMEKMIAIERHAYKKKAAAMYKYNPIHYEFLKVKWLNFYHPDDVVANQPLICYKLDEADQISCDDKERSKAGKSKWCERWQKSMIKFVNKIPLVNWIPLTLSFMKSLEVHGSYWENKKMYQEIASRFLQGQKDL